MMNLNQSISENNQNSEKINKISLNNSSHIQLGTRIIYNGPVTISNSILGKKRARVFKCCCFNISKETLKRLLTSFTIVLTLFFLFALVLISFYLSNVHDNKNEKIYKKSSSLRKFKFYSREDWNATRVEAYYQLKHPIRRVIITHTVNRKCYVESQCVSVMKEIQNLHIDWDYGDIGFNFVIMNDGSIFEGRGWDTMGAHTYGYNNNSIGIAYNGNFMTQVPPQAQILAGFFLLNEGVRLGKLSADFKVYGMRQFQRNLSPGDAFYEMIKTWDNWSEDIYECCTK